MDDGIAPQHVVWWFVKRRSRAAPPSSYPHPLFPIRSSKLLASSSSSWMMSLFIGEFDEELLKDIGFIGVSPGAPLRKNEPDFFKVLLHSWMAFRSFSVRGPPHWLLTWISIQRTKCMTCDTRNPSDEAYHFSSDSTSPYFRHIKCFCLVHQFGSLDITSISNLNEHAIMD